MFKLFYAFAARVGATDRTFVGDIYVAAMLGYCMAMHVAPDGHRTVVRGIGDIEHAKALADEAQQDGLRRWLAVTPSRELEHHLRLSYGAMQKVYGVRRTEVEKLYEMIVGELEARARGESVFA